MPNSIATLAVLVFMAVLVAGYFYMQWAKSRDSAATKAPQHPADEGSSQA